MSTIAHTLAECRRRIETAWQRAAYMLKDLPPGVPLMQHRAAMVVLSLASGALLAGCEMGRPTTETFTWKGPVTAESWMRLRNVSGDFAISEGTGDSAEIQLVIERSSAYAPLAQVKVLQTSDGIVACVLYGKDNTCTATEYKGGNTWASGVLPFMKGSTTVTGTVVLPKGIKLDAESVNGDMSVNSISADVQLTTVNGDIEVRGTRAGVKINTTNGDIDLGVDAMGSGVSIETTNGNVKLELPDALNAALTLSTVNGELDLAVPATITTKTSKKVVATLGTSGSPIDITTTNGDITLRQRSAP
jgi:Putative adhesin